MIRNCIVNYFQHAYNALPMDSKVIGLLNSLQDASKPEDERQMATVLLRRLFSTEFMEFYPKVMCFILMMSRYNGVHTTFFCGIGDNFIKFVYHGIGVFVVDCV